MNIPKKVSLMTVGKNLVHGIKQSMSNLVIKHVKILVNCGKIQQIMNTNNLWKGTTNHVKILEIFGRNKSYISIKLW